MGKMSKRKHNVCCKGAKKICEMWCEGEGEVGWHEVKWSEVKWFVDCTFEYICKYNCCTCDSARKISSYSKRESYKEKESCPNNLTTF